MVDDLDAVVDALDVGDGGQAQYSFLRAIISGDLIALDPVAGSVMNLTVDHHLKYLSLMARLHPDMVYEYLSTHDSYRAEDALTLSANDDSRSEVMSAYGTSLLRFVGCSSRTNFKVSFCSSVAWKILTWWLSNLPF